MLTAILPKQADNRFRGQQAAIWIFVLVVIMKTGMAAVSLFNARQAASGADGLPLDRYVGGGAETVLALFALVGLCQLVLALLGALAAIRYRSLIPLFFLVFLLEQLSRKLVLAYYPITRSTTESSGSIVTMVLLGLMVLGLLLSMIKRRDAG